MNILILSAFLGLIYPAFGKHKVSNPQLIQNPYASYLNDVYQYDQNKYAVSKNKLKNEPSAPLRKLSLNADSSVNLPDNIQLQKMMENYQQAQMANQREDAEAEDFKDLSDNISHENRGLSSKKERSSKKTRNLEGEIDETKELDKKEEAKEEIEEKKEELGENTGESEESVEKYIDRLLVRTKSIDDKIDHIIFHNGHDLAGLTAHYTPYGIQMLPSTKNPDSVDQKLKMIDYMHNLGGGYNPMLHSMLPSYLGNYGGQNTGIKVDSLYGMNLGGMKLSSMKVL